MMEPYHRELPRLLGLLVMLLLTVTGTFAFQVNESIDNFRISFDAINDTDAVAKFWGIPGSYVDTFPEFDDEKPTNAYMLIAGNVSDFDERLACCLILIFDNPVNASIQSTQDYLLKNSTTEYIRVFDKLIDGHEAVLLNMGKEPEDPAMAYMAMYWLDKVDDQATKAVILLSQWPWEDGAEQFMKTAHVEEVVPQFME